MELVSGQLIQMIDTVAREKNIPREDALEAVEMAISKASRQKYGYEYDIRTKVDSKSGDVEVTRYIEAVATEEEIEHELRQMLVKDADKKQPGIKAGEFIIEQLPAPDLGRIAAQGARQVIMQRIRESEKHREFNEYKDRVGEIINGIVKRVEFGNITVDLGKAEGIIRRDEQIPRENLRQGNRVRAYIYDVKEDSSGPQIFLSRTHPQFMAKLFEQEVPEVYDNVIEIKGVARDPGSRAKIAVYSKDPTIDPRGACIGMRGSRVQAVRGELQDENIDVIQWTPDPATFVVDSLYPAEVIKVVLDEDAKRVEVIVGEENLSQAIGRRGQNVRLASDLTGWTIDIMTEAQESEKAVKEIEEYSKIFMDALDVDDVIARLLATEGYRSINDIAFVPMAEIAHIQGFDEDIAQELKSRAETALAEQQAAVEEKITKFKVQDDLLALEGITPEIAATLAEKEGVKSLDDFADLATDELMEALPEGTMNKDQAEKMIMAARAHWFEDEEPAQEQTEGDAEETAAETAEESAKPEKTAKAS